MRPIFIVSVFENEIKNLTKAIFHVIHYIPFLNTSLSRCADLNLVRSLLGKGYNDKKIRAKTNRLALKLD